MKSSPAVDVASYELGLQGCIEQARHVDAGHVDRVAAYKACADRLDGVYGRPDGGAL